MVQAASAAGAARLGLEWGSSGRRQKHQSTVCGGSNRYAREMGELADHAYTHCLPACS